MRFILLSHKYSGFQAHYDDEKLTLEWFGAADFDGAELIGLSNFHIFPLKDERKSYSAVLTANFIKASLYNPEKVLSTIRIEAHCDHTPLTNYRGKCMTHNESLSKYLFKKYLKLDYIRPI